MTLPVSEIAQIVVMQLVCGERMAKSDVNKLIGTELDICCCDIWHYLRNNMLVNVQCKTSKNNPTYWFLPEPYIDEYLRDQSAHMRSKQRLDAQKSLLSDGRRLQRIIQRRGTQFLQVNYEKAMNEVN